MNLGGTIILCTSREENMLLINYEMPFILRHILTSEMLKCGGMCLSVDEIYFNYITQVNFGFSETIFKLSKS